MLFNLILAQHLLFNGIKSKFFSQFQCGNRRYVKNKRMSVTPYSFFMFAFSFHSLFLFCFFQCTLHYERHKFILFSCFCSGITNASFSYSFFLHECILLCHIKLKKKLKKSFHKSFKYSKVK